MDGHDVYDHGGSSAPSTSEYPNSSHVAATSTNILTFKDIVPDMQKTMAEMGKLEG